LDSAVPGDGQPKPLPASTMSFSGSGSGTGITLRGLVAELSRGLKVDYRSVWKFVQAETLSFNVKVWI
jgi:transposase